MREKSSALKGAAEVLRVQGDPGGDSEYRDGRYINKVVSLLPSAPFPHQLGRPQGKFDPVEAWLVRLSRWCILLMTIIDD